MQCLRSMTTSSCRRGYNQDRHSPMMGAYLFPKIFSSFQRRYSIWTSSCTRKARCPSVTTPGAMSWFVVMSSQVHRTTCSCCRCPKIRLSAVGKTTPGSEESHLPAGYRRGEYHHAERGSFLRQTILSKMKAANITPNIVLESNQVVTLKRTRCQYGVGIAFCSIWSWKTRRASRRFRWR